MDPTESFCQKLDSEALLKQHGPTLVADAKEILNAHAHARLAGTIILPDSREAPALRGALSRVAGRPLPEQMLVGVCPRAMIEAVLTSHVGTERWKEEPWQSQQVLPVVVATRDGLRFGFFDLETPDFGDAGLR
jgi:hypothetical protein